MGRRPFIQRLQEFLLLSRVHGDIGFGIRKVLRRDFGVKCPKCRDTFFVNLFVQTANLTKGMGVFWGFVHSGAHYALWQVDCTRTQCAAYGCPTVPTPDTLFSPPLRSCAPPDKRDTAGTHIVSCSGREG